MGDGSSTIRSACVECNFLLFVCWDEWFLQILIWNYVPQRQCWKIRSSQLFRMLQCHGPCPTPIVFYCECTCNLSFHVNFNSIKLMCLSYHVGGLHIFISDSWLHSCGTLKFTIFKAALFKDQSECHYLKMDDPLLSNIWGMPCVHAIAIAIARYYALLRS